MRMTIMKVPTHHISMNEHRMVFRHAWKGVDQYWIVPMIYVVSIRPARDPGFQIIRLSSSYWEQPVNESVAA